MKSIGWMITLYIIIIPIHVCAHIAHALYYVPSTYLKKADAGQQNMQYHMSCNHVLYVIKHMMPQPTIDWVPFLRQSSHENS
jgi:hypothetical protein